MNATPIIHRASEIEVQELDPIWNGVIWRGKYTLLAGDPGLGKSLITVDIAARVTRGAAMPCEAEPAEPYEQENVLFITAEDDPADTIKPRLIAANAACDRVIFWSGMQETFENGKQRQHGVALDRHLHELRKIVRENSIGLVIIDPISAFMGSVESHNNAEVRAVLGSLSQLASRHHFSILAVSHLNKGTPHNPSALARVSGSGAFAAAARAVFMISRDSDHEGRRLMLPGKVNLSRDGVGYSYRVEECETGHPRVLWAAELETRRADDVFKPEHSARQEARDAGVERAKEWLAKYLVGGPQSQREIRAAARNAGHSTRHVDAAKALLRVHSSPVGHQGAWMWSLPVSGVPHNV